ANFPPMVWFGHLYHTGKFAFFVPLFSICTPILNDQVQLVVKSPIFSKKKNDLKNHKRLNRFMVKWLTGLIEQFKTLNNM
ncbi:hypothetical protein, partial [Anoxybacillus sp. EFIL]|uniref:hypothetical protein n=1 Tax=Anoxybacillus sp. EFIL TaxID=2508869 RepID=UPI001C0EF991